MLVGAVPVAAQTGPSSTGAVGGAPTTTTTTPVAKASTIEQQLREAYDEASGAEAAALDVYKASLAKTEALDAQIAEIEELDRQRDRLIARKEIIEQLQATRSQMVHLFDELVRTLPEGVQLSSIKQGGSTLTLEGVAQSNARVSAYMRNLDASAWLKESEIIKIEAKGTDKAVPYVFSLKVNLEDPNAKDPNAEAATVAVVNGGAQP